MQLSNLMTGALVFISGSAICLTALLGLWFFISSIQEKEKRATIFGAVQFIIMLVVVIAFFALNSVNFFDSGVGFNIMVGLLIIGGVGTFLFFGRIGGNPRALMGTNGYIVGAVKQWDERDIQFSDMMRMMYLFSKMAPPKSDSGKPGISPGKLDSKDKADNEASLKPQTDAPPMSPNEMKKLLPSITDDEMNSSGLGTLGPADNIGTIDGAGGAYNCAAVNGSSVIPMIWADPPMHSPQVSTKQLKIAPEEAAVRVKGFAKNVGAALVGVTAIDKNWIYSHKGVSGIGQQEWGKAVELNHTYAVIFAEEMSFETIGSAPHTPIIIESMKNYAKGAFIGAQVANYIAGLGYESRANHMASYEGLMVPLAVDAGLGELSRMGYLISKEYGPRIRLGMVTTNLPLAVDKPVDIGVQHFCKICKKCTNTCPSQAISDLDDYTEENGSLRWKIDDAACMGYWQKVGTDCGVCMRVCPWSHDRTFPHKVIVQAVSRSRFSRIVFNQMDDLFYGKKPKPKAPPAWAAYKAKLIDRPATREEMARFVGKWTLCIETPMGTDTPFLIIEKEGDKLKGHMYGSQGTPDIYEIRLDDTSFSFKVDGKGPVGKMTLEVNGTLMGNSLLGTVYTPMGPADLKGEKQSQNWSDAF